MATTSAAASSTAAARVITVAVTDWSFSPNVIRVKKGENVTVQLQGGTGTHSFAVPELGINQRIAAGETASVTIPTDKTGTFAGRCMVPCGEGHPNMTFQIVVE